MSRRPLALCLALFLAALCLPLAACTTTPGPSSDTFAHVAADDTGTTIALFMTRPEQKLVSVTPTLENRIFMIDLRTSMWGDGMSWTQHFDITASDYDEIVLRCNGLTVPITN